MTLAITLVLLLAGVAFVVLLSALRLGSRDEHRFTFEREMHTTP